MNEEITLRPNDVKYLFNVLAKTYRRNTLNIDMAIEIQFSFMHIFNAYNDVK